MFSTILLLLSVVFFLLAAFGVASVGGLSIVPLALALGFGASLAAKFSV